MAGRTEHFEVDGSWRQIASARGRESLLLLDAYGRAEIAIADGELPSPGLTQGHAVTGGFVRRLKGSEIAWARGGGSIYVTPLSAISGGEATAAMGVAAAVAYSQPFETRASAEAASIPQTIKYISINSLQFVRDPAGTALVTADGGAWSPLGGVRPQHFGAVGNGIADDSAAMQAAVDWGAPIDLTDGVYALSSLRLSSRSRLTGRGTLDFSQRSTYANSVSAPLILARGSAADDVALTADAMRGAFTLFLASTAGILPGDLIEVGTPAHNGGYVDSSTQVISAEQFLVAEVISATSLRLTEPVSDEGGFSVANGAVARRISALDDIYIGPNVTIKGKGRPDSGYGDFGVVMFYARRPRIHCRFVDVDASSVRFESCYDAVADGLRIVHPKQGANSTVNYGVVPSGSSKHVRILNCHFENMRHGVVTSHLSGAALDSNGIRLNMRGTVRYLTVSGCTFINTWHAGFATHNDADLVTVEGNNFIGCLYGVNPRERRVVIRGNRFQGCAQSIRISAHPRDLTIEDNESSGSDGGSFVISTLDDLRDISNWAIRGNRVSNMNGGRGINLIFNPAAAVQDISITDNVFSDIVSDTASGAAIGISGATVEDLTIAANILRRITVGSAINITGANRAALFGNDIKSCTTGIRTVGSFTASYAKGNYLIGCGTSWVGSSNLANSATIGADNTLA